MNKLIKQGAAVEKEHTDNDKDAREIARDHIAERPDYYKKLAKIEEIKIPPKVKKAAATGMTLANLATLGQVAGDAAEGRKGADPKRGLVAATSALPGAVGWGATGLNYTIKGYDKAREHLRAKVKQMKEEQIDEISAELVGKVSNARFWQGKAPSKTLSRAINKKFIESGKKDKGRVNKEKEDIKEVAMAMPPAVQPPAIVGQQVPGVRRQAPRPTQVSGSAAGRMAGQSGSMSARPNVKVSSGVQPSIERSWSRSGSARMGSGAGSMSASPTKVGTSFSQGGSNVGQKMAAAKQTSPVVKGMTTAGRDAAVVVSKAAPAASRIAGAALRVAGGPAATAAMAVMSPTAAGAGEDEKKRQETLKSYNPYKSSGRSVSDYEKQALTPQKYDTPKAAATKVDAPTPPSRPDYFSRGQAFSAARKEAGGSEGKFSYDNKSYQTNLPGEKYKPETQLKQTSIKEETTMDNKDLINEAIDNIMSENLVEMKENFLNALNEKAMEKLEERKKEIAANYFAE